MGSFYQILEVKTISSIRCLILSSVLTVQFVSTNIFLMFTASPIVSHQEYSQQSKGKKNASGCLTHGQK